MRGIVSLLLLGFTFLMFNDFFPEALPGLNVSKWIVLLLFLVIFICISVSADKELEEHRTLKWTLFSSLYLMFVIIGMSLLGGQSTSGISLDSPIVWALFLVSLFQISVQLKRRNSKKSQEL
ncbi:hypothetical protein QWY22_06690 [Planococcus liqunii]|uniref:Permease n=1 Tax=Planococcus liqunii TaxID=3058394 RepID=A0ABT8MQJ7_9BACL|nr:MULTISPECIES: hypothetical protein [unclassified Planococcus (in: firmicutes)]MDN7227178.1 hypothetical protein [Planococcus sp. N064]WKA52239.1 hypothetical protein QWY22_06690 [Planococcus sp. N056]